MRTKVFCRVCDRWYERLDMHLKEKHSLDLGLYLKENYITKEDNFLFHYDTETPRKNICQICNKKVVWLQDHLLQEHETHLNDYLDDYLVDYQVFLKSARNKIHKHHQLKVWDCFSFYTTRIDKMVATLAYKKSLTEVMTQELHSKAIMMFHRFHYEYDPGFKTVNPGYTDGKTLDYYEKYMFLKIRRQLWYFIQKHYIDTKRESCIGSSSDIESYNLTSPSEVDITNQALWENIKKHLKEKQIIVLELFLQGYSQREISEQLELTQSWVSSIKTSILDVMRSLASDDYDFGVALREYYNEMVLT